MKKNIKGNAGFTIIELIVVIAIIAVLAAIVLVNVTQYIAKGRDAAAEGNLSTMLVNSAAWYSDHSSYAAFPADATYTSITTALTNAGYTTTDESYYIFTCASASGTVDRTCSDAANSTNWCASVKLEQYSPVQYFCVDSTGAKYTSITTTCRLTSSFLKPAGTCNQ
jgi:prepilin-type N-terminal cleavage/methylation domain-containing protein